MYEKAKAALTELKKTPPRRKDHPLYRDVIRELSPQIRDSMERGYPLKDIVEAINKSEGLSMTTKTARQYLHIYAPESEQ